MSRSIPLNPGQLEILAWVRDGARADAYDDFRPRIIARALHNRGLVAVAGHGKTWSAVLTDDGSYYLDDGEYPVEPEQPEEAASIIRSAPRAKPKPPAKPRAPKSPRVGPTDAMMAALAAAPGNQIEIEYGDSGRYD